MPTRRRPKPGRPNGVGALRCRRGTIFCGGRYYPGAGLCEWCYQTRWLKRVGRRGPQDRRRATFKLEGRGIRRWRRVGADLQVVFPGGLFADGRQRKVSYARWVYERVVGVGTLRPGEVVVDLAGRARPRFEDLVVAPAVRAATAASLAEQLAEADRMAEQPLTPF